jgi:hypothetical protein
MGTTPEELFTQRAGRIQDALDLKVPDRVPLEIAFGYFPAVYAGLTCEAAYYDYDGWLAACRKTVLDFGADMSSVQMFFPGEVLALLGPKAMMWPGHGTSALHSHQFVELENMKADELGALWGDQTDFMLRKYFPRTLSALEPFSDLPSYSGPSFGHYSVLALAEAFSTPGISEAIRKLSMAGEKMREWRPKLETFALALQKLGFPPFSDSMALAPFDAISDHLRGMRGSMLDMYRQPDTLLEACDAILKKMVERIRPAVPGAVNRVAIPLHRGSEGFMSIKQFEKFYWPGLKALILALIDKGQTPLVFFEGDYTSRLEYLMELPKGKVFAHLDTTDIAKAKKVIGGHLCYSGNMPCSLLQTGTVQEVKDYTVRMLDLCAKDGGFIMSSRSPVDDARPETLKAMIDTTLRYRY